MKAEPKTLSELLEQTRPVNKGNRFRGKSLKCRGKKEDYQHVQHDTHSQSALDFALLGIRGHAATEYAARQAQTDALSGLCRQQEAAARQQGLGIGHTQSWGLGLGQAAQAGFNEWRGFYGST